MKNTLESNNDFLKWFKANHSYIYDKLYDIVIFSVMENYFFPTENEFQVFSSAIKEAYRKDETYLDLIWMTDFLTINYCDNKITLDDIKGASKYQILDSVISSNIEILKSYQNDMIL